MGYVILQTHALSPPPLSTNQRKKNSRQTRSSSRNESQLVAQATSGEITRVREESTLQLTAFQNRHNFQPLVFFLIGGVRGLFLVSKNHRNAPLADCMSFAQAMSVIHQHSKTARTPQEPVWKNLSAYLVELFQPSLKTPNQIVPLANPPNPHKLAHAITTDFLSYWSQTQPSSPFIIPHSTRQITEKWNISIFITVLVFFLPPWNECSLPHVEPFFDTSTSCIDELLNKWLNSIRTGTLICSVIFLSYGIDYLKSPTIDLWVQWNILAYRSSQISSQPGLNLLCHNVMK